MCKCLVFIIIFAMIIDTYGDIPLPWYTPLAWDAEGYSQRGCTFPNGVLIPGHIYVSFIEGISQGFKLYLSMANSPYYRFQHQKIMNTNASTMDDIRALDPRVIFPNLLGLSTPPTLSYAETYFYGSEDKYYKVWCTPLNPSVSNATCYVTDQSAGAKTNCFGTGCDVATTIVHYDASSYTEFHCFQQADGSRNIPIFNTISLNRNLTADQITAITKRVVELGFDARHIIVYGDL